MKRLILCLVVLCVTAVTAEEKARPAETMTVTRCHAMQKNGLQCPNQAEAGKQYCWKHTGAAQAIGEAAEGVGAGASNVWHTTKTWSTNAWNATKRGANKARVGIVELFGGKDAADDEAKKKGADEKSTKKSE